MVRFDGCPAQRVFAFDILLAWKAGNIRLDHNMSLSVRTGFKAIGRPEEECDDSCSYSRCEMHCSSIARNQIAASFNKAGQFIKLGFTDKIRYVFMFYLLFKFSSEAFLSGAAEKKYLCIEFFYQFFGQLGKIRQRPLSYLSRCPGLKTDDKIVLIDPVFSKNLLAYPFPLF